MADITNVIMPQMGESITEATITGWRKNVGDAVNEGEALLDISTAKVEVEIPAPASGVIAALLYEKDATVPIDTVIAHIAPEGTVVSASAPKAAQAASAGATTAAPVSSPAATAVVAAPAVPSGTNGTHSSGNGTAALAGDGDVDSQRRALLLRRSTPLVRNMAREFEIDLTAVPGSGVHGRVTRKDLEAYMQSGGGAAKAAASAPAPKPTPVSSTADADIAPMSTMRRQIAEHMIRSQRTSSHVYTVFEVDFTRLERLRMQHRGAFEKQFGAKLTPLVFVIKALTEVLPKHPALNASIREDHQVVYHKPINIGLAVALADGLIVPVLHRAEDMSLGGLARAMQEKAKKARENKLMPADIERGTFTVTSPGQLGAVMGTPVISQPQVAILHFGAVTKTPVVVTGPDGEDTIAIRQRAYLTLGFDHRLVDGWGADTFMAELKKVIETSAFGLGG